MGGFAELPLLNVLDKLYNTFTKPELTDLLIVVGVYLLLRKLAAKEDTLRWRTFFFSMALSVLLLFAISFRKFNSAIFVLGNKYQFMLSAFCVLGFTVPLYATLRLVEYLFCENTLSSKADSPNHFLEKHLGLIGFTIIFLCWLPWILLNYPGSGCPDSMQQLSQFLGDEVWDMHHPPLSTLLMGGLFVIGRGIVNANFGFFLYCLFQTCTGAWIFSLSMKKLHQLGVPSTWCLLGISYFALTPFWGTYAQWVEKDLLFAQIVVLQAICMLEVIRKKECTKKDMILLTTTSLLTSLLRHNGIYTVLPALLLLAVWLKGRSRRIAGTTLLTTFLVYEVIVKGFFPAIGLGRTTIVDALSIPFQQTARYVCEHTDEITDAERAAIEGSFVSYDIMFQYDPLIADPIKNYCNGKNLDTYLKTWFQMFWKHPETYVAATFNLGYGYLAPVSQRIEAWIQGVYYDYMNELGLYHPFDIKYNHYLVYLWNCSMALPLIQYLASPGFYTWILLILAVMLFSKRRYEALILFVPGFMNLLVCLASPVAGTMRYALPTVAMTPLLIGWTWYALRTKRRD
ncbi:MAG: hypothetical protein IJ794_18880 [Lachnospiraceae bacterium]|nr:hypothetical protein [Lachnospiraceae bacterium]